MSVLIIYMSHHGCARRSAQMLAGLIPGAGLFDLGAGGRPDLDNSETVIIGGSIHLGKIQRKLKRFCSRNLDRLAGKKLGLYVCCMEEGESAIRQFEGAFPEELRKHASAVGFFGGEFALEKMNFIERAMIKKAVKIEESVSKFDPAAVEAFAERIQRKEKV